MGVAANFIERVKTVFGNDTPKVILDVGSRDLEESIELQTAFPNAKIIAFEPNPEQFRICLEKSNGYPNITVCEYACSDTEGETDFYVVNINHGASSILEPIRIAGGWAENYQDHTWRKISGIQMRRLDTILPELGIEQVDVVWMDVQGNELRALKGLGDYINGVRMMHTEAAGKPYYKGHIVRDELESWIIQQGFETEFLIEKMAGDYDESDLVCIRK